MSETHGADPGAVGDEDALLEALKAAPRATHTAENGLRAEIVALVGEHRFDYTYQDTGVSVCRQHGAAGYQSTCPRAWLRDNLSSVFPPGDGA